jgi:molybdenum cofactor biosynthesis protein B
MDHETSTRRAKVAVLTVSDTRSPSDDKSGSYISEALINAGHTVHCQEIVPDEHAPIVSKITTWAKDQAIDAIIVNGGTGASPRDVTPDAIMPLMSGTLDGFGELFRMLSYKEIGAAAMLSRAVAGWIETDTDRTPVFLLPGSPAGVSLALSELIVPQLGHLLDICSMETSK